MVDAALDAAPDAAPAIDAAADAALDATTDAASDAGLPPIGQSNGCCQTGAQPNGWWLALGVVGLLRRRRRS
jgi:MYXO-CTERM domain-containing protein